MAAQRTKPQRTTATTKGPTPKQVKILTVKAQHPDLTTRQIATLADTGHTHVIATLQRYGVDQGQVESYKQHRADLLAGIQSRILSTVTDDDIKKANLYQRVTAAAILYDKERLERGQSTSNTAVAIAAEGPLRDLVDAMVGRPNGSSIGSQGGKQGDPLPTVRPIIDVESVTA